MKNNIIRAIIAVVGLVGYYWLFIGASQMKASVIITFIFCWTAFVLGTLFFFSPEIKRLVFKKDRLELDRYKQQVDKALVEYDEFKETIYPLLEITLGQIASAGRFGGGPKSTTLVDFVKETEKLINSGNYDNEKLTPILDGAKAQVLSEFGTELNIISGKTTGDSTPSSYISSGTEDLSREKYADKENAYIDFKSLKKIENGMSEGPAKQKYSSKLKQLKEFYDQYYN